MKTSFSLYVYSISFKWLGVNDCIAYLVPLGSSWHQSCINKENTVRSLHRICNFPNDIWVPNQKYGLQNMGSHQSENSLTLEHNAYYGGRGEEGL